MVEQRDIEIILNNPIDWECFRDKTVLVTGATGRLGMYFVEALVKADIDWNLNLNILALARNEKKLVQVFGNSLKLSQRTPASAGYYRSHFLGRRCTLYFPHGRSCKPSGFYQTASGYFVGACTGNPQCDGTCQRKGKPENIICLNRGDLRPVGK